MRRITAILIAAALSAGARADSNPPAPEGLLLRGFENVAAANRPGEQATLAGVLTTMRVDAAGELSATQDAAALAPLVKWYRDRGQYYAAYADFAPGDSSAVGFIPEISAAGRNVDLDGAIGGPSLFRSETYDAIVAVAKAYVDAGVDAIEYDTAWVEYGAGPFDAQTMIDFRAWLNLRYNEATLQAHIDASYDDAAFDYGAFLRAEGVTAANYASASIDGTPLLRTKHWRLWYSFLRDKERQIVAALVDEANTYAQSEIGREIGFYFNRYGYVDRPADRWFLSEYASGDLGETHFQGQTWNFHTGKSLEPVLRANLKTYGNRFESWNHPPLAATAAQSVFLAESIANNGVGTWIDAELDDAVDTAPIARLARRYSEQLDHAPVSEAAIFYPLATVLRNRLSQAGGAPSVGGSHEWYLGLAYILKALNVNYDVAFAGDGLALPDAFSSADLGGYSAVFASEVIQTTDSQFTEVLDYVNAGGTLIVSGTNCFRYDALGDDRSLSRSYAGKTWTEIFGAAGTVAIGAGEVKVVTLSAWATDAFSTPFLNTGLTAHIRNGFDAALPAQMPAVETSASGRVRVLRYRDASDNSETYQLLNYTFNTPGTVVTAQGAFTITFPAPSGFVGVPVAQYANSADSDPVALPITDLGGGQLQATIPSLGYWGILRVGSPMDDDAHPNLRPIAFFDRLFDYEAFGSIATRALTYTAADDSEIEQLQVYYQIKDTGSGTFGGWTAGQTFTGFDTNHLSAQSLDITLPSEGHFRIQLLATDDEAANSVLYEVAGFDTEIGYDTTPVDRSALIVTPNHGVANGAAITAPVTPNIAFSGAADAVSGVSNYNFIWDKDGVTLDTGGDTASDPTTLPLPAIVAGEYGTYTLSLSFQNGAEIWDESAPVYSLVYTVKPTYTGSAAEIDAIVGDNVSLNLEYTNPYGEIAIQWYKDGEPIAEATEASLNLPDVTEDDSGTYYATIANPAGPIDSAEFVVTVITPLQITQQPSGATVDPGDPFSLNVEAEGTGNLLYQWMLDSVDIPGATGATYAIASAVKATHQGPYRVRIRDDLTTTTSNTAFVTVTGIIVGDPVVAPSGLSATDASAQIALAWTDNSGDETGFSIERREQGAPNWTPLATTAANATSHNDPLDIGADVYEYRVKAVRDGTSSPYSNIATVSRAPVAISVIVSGGAPLDFVVEVGSTVAALRARIATESGFAGNTLRIYRGATELTDGAATLQSVGISVGDQFTAIVNGEVAGATYANWQLARFGATTTNRKPIEDSNGDGVDNFTEYALGMEPESADRLSHLLALIEHGDTVVARYAFNETAAEANVALVVSTNEAQTWVGAAAFGMTYSPTDGSSDAITIATWTKTGVDADSILLRLEVSADYGD